MSSNNYSIVQLIEKKRDGKELSHDEIQAFINHTVNGTAQDCQIGAMLMAMQLQNLTNQEIASLTNCMRNSGEVLTWPKEWSSILVDKHSTGGVGDKISLVLAPALAACGLKVPMISGRGLDFTGGTLDKLQSIPGYKIHLNKDEMLEALKKAGCFIAGQSSKLVPADMELYKRRDITATVPNAGLITGSILSKKSAEGISSLILDIKVGKAAFKSSVEEAEELATTVLETSKILGLNTSIVLTRMDSVLGCYVGNSLEVIESVQCMKGKGPEDIDCLVEELGAHLLKTCAKVKSVEDGRLLIKNSLHDGSALQHFCTMLTSQGVDANIASKVCADPWSVLPLVPRGQVTTLKAEKSGIVVSLDGLTIGKTCRDLGAGRMVFSQNIDPRVGVRLLVKEGHRLEIGAPWMEVHHSSPVIPEAVRQKLQGAIKIDENKSNFAVNSCIIKVLSCS
ncbi:thymidine phosphorylase-like [Hetaerina americana]|uniref:thymidine phosphorylase-like n=1 Tax=Hetaerina americana TaxID=62018 RepID=UPI003A7F4B4B